MKAIPPIKAVMTPFPYWIESDATVRRARKVMRERGIRHLPVTRGGRLISVLTERQLQRVGDRHGSADTPIGGICEKNAYVVGLSEPLDRVLFHMAENHVEAALVVKDGRLAGIFTRTDVCSRFGKLLRSLFPPGGDDAA